MVPMILTGVITLAAVATIDPAPSPSGGFDLNTLVTGGAGATIAGLIYWVVKLILDRTIPSRSDARANVTLVLEGLNNMVKVLQEEKTADAARLAAKQARIDQLEEAADKDYDRIAELRGEILELRNRLAQKDRHINSLVTELRKFGAVVTGLELEDVEDLEITMPPAEVKKLRDEAGSGQ